ncbi:MAG TPA: hypothetical protein VEX86_02080 [Longimicrobium sp.]|nr:hypothetical protein [Longimicrobium sp.]
MSNISLNPADLQVTSFAPEPEFGVAPGGTEPQPEALGPTNYVSCRGTCNGCTSPQYAC